jgi:hypothetical protein
LPHGLTEASTVSIVWEKIGDGFYATVVEPAGELIHFRLSVMHGGGSWTWAVWRPGR